MSIRDLSCIALNCNSLVSHYRRSELIALLEKRRPDIACLSETGFKSRHKFNIPGYSLYRTDSPFGKGGTAIVVKNGVPTHSPKSFIFLNTLATSICVGNINDFVVITAIYSKIISELELKEMFNLNHRVVIAGDFNACHASWNCPSNNSNGDKLLEFCLTNVLQISAPIEPTFSRGYNILDFVVSKNVAIIEQPKILHEFCSDHFPVSFKIPLRAPISQEPLVKISNYAKADWLAFKIHVNRRLDPDLKIETMEELERAVMKLTNVISSAINFAVPKTRESRKP